MRYSLLVLIFILSSCTVAHYERTATSESFDLTTWFKSVDGLEANRGDFSLKIDATHTQDPADTLGKTLEIIREVTGKSAITEGDSND